MDHSGDFSTLQLDRVRAPGRLALVEAFLNTTNRLRDLDLIADRDGLATWTAARGLDVQIAPGDEDVARRFREALRAALAGDEIDLAPFADAARLTLQGLDLVSRADGIDGLIGVLLATLHDARVDGTLARFKVCANGDCRWAFYDASKNRSARWCAMAVCGNRAKVRAHRSRRS